MNATYHTKDRNSETVYKAAEMNRSFLAGLSLAPLGNQNPLLPRPWTHKICTSDSNTGNTQGRMMLSSHLYPVCVCVCVCVCVAKKCNEGFTKGYG